MRTLSGLAGRRRDKPTTDRSVTSRQSPPSSLPPSRSRPSGTRRPRPAVPCRTMPHATSGPSTLAGPQCAHAQARSLMAKIGAYSPSERCRSCRRLAGSASRRCRHRQTGTRLTVGREWRMGVAMGAATHEGSRRDEARTRRNRELGSRRSAMRPACASADDSLHWRPHRRPYRRRYQRPHRHHRMRRPTSSARPPRSSP